LLNNEIAIPFDAFGPRDAEVEDIEVIADEIDGTIVAAEPTRSAATKAARTPSSGPLRAADGRVVLAFAGPDSGTLAAADEIIEQFLDCLARATGAAVPSQDQRGQHDPADLVYWARVDATRGRLATAQDIVVCTHHLGSAQRSYIVTVDGPAFQESALVAAAQAVGGVTRTALLTAAGLRTTEPADSVVTLAAAQHAQRLGGRAEVFPGQQWLADDLTVVDVLERTVIDEVRSTQGPYSPSAVLRAYGYVRPSFADGLLVVTVGHDDPLVVTPWEVRYCRPCCGIDH
jgi:hypothetical protein